MQTTPEIRIRSLNNMPHRGDGEYVLYWMVAARRARYNFSLQRAVQWSARLGKPLIVLEALRCGYRWASDRLHCFVIQGMADNAQAFSRNRVLYYPYVEPQQGDGRGLLATLARRACLVVTDEFPCFFLPRMQQSAADKLDVLIEAVDSNGLLPMSATDEDFARAYDFRRFLQRHLPPHLELLPKEHPLRGIQLPKPPQFPTSITQRWPQAELPKLLSATGLQELPIDHDVPPSAIQGGTAAAAKVMRAFIDGRLSRYADGRNHPDDDQTSGFSPYLHFGHLSTHEVFQEIATSENWSPEDLGSKTKGAREGWWGMSAAAESLLDELIIWRELGFTFCWHRQDYDQYESLPDWAQATLEQHQRDRREYVYSLEEFETAGTHDPLWNAAQRQLVAEGRVHNYLRMLWGKKILHWTENARDALDIMIQLNNKYALDGRDPNSYSGIFWVLGRYDRAWGPERPIFGKVRYMTSESTRKKLRVNEYLERYGSQGGCYSRSLQSWIVGTV